MKYEITYITIEPIDATSMKKQLAYPIKHFKEAYYTTKILDALPQEQDDKNILRKLVVKIPKHAHKTGFKPSSKIPKLKIEELDKKIDELLEEGVTQ